MGLDPASLHCLCPTFSPCLYGNGHEFFLCSLVWLLMTPISFLFFFFFLPPQGIWNSQDRVKSELQLWLTPQMQQCRILNPLHWPGVKPVSQRHHKSHCPTVGTLTPICFKLILCSFLAPFSFSNLTTMMTQRTKITPMRFLYLHG